MATTMRLIAKNVLSTSAASVSFSSIPSAGYTDLIVVVSARTTRNLHVDGAYYRFNGDTNTGNYSTRRLYGDGTNALSDTTRDGVVLTTGATATANTFGASETYIPNAFGSTAKSYSSSVTNENNATVAYPGATAALWTGTAAISSIVIHPEVGPDFVANSSFYLYGITKA